MCQRYFVVTLRCWYHPRESLIILQQQQKERRDFCLKYLSRSAAEMVSTAARRLCCHRARWALLVLRLNTSLIKIKVNHVMKTLTITLLSKASSVTRLSDVWKLLPTNLLPKIAQKDCWLFCGLFWKRSVNVITAVDAKNYILNWNYQYLSSNFNCFL